MSTKNDTHHELGLCNLSWSSDLKTKGLSCRDGRLEMKDKKVYALVEIVFKWEIVGFCFWDESNSLSLFLCFRA